MSTTKISKPQNKEVDLTPSYYVSEEILLRHPTFRLLWEAQIELLLMVEDTRCTKKQKEYINSIWQKLIEVFEWEKGLYVERSFNFFLPESEDKHDFNKAIHFKQ